MKSITRMHVLSSVLFLVLSFLLSANFSFAETKTFIKEYTYHAGDEDSRNSSRTIALREVKRLLLEELGTYLESQTEVKNFQMTKDQITTLTAGIVSAEVIEDKWDGKAYWLKAKITANPQDVIKSIDSLRKDRVKVKELEELRKKSEKLLKENERLNKELKIAKGGTKQETAQAYKQNIDNLSATEWFERGYKLDIYGNYTDAVKAYSKAIELNPQDAAIYYNRGFTYGKLDNYQQAITDYNKAIELETKYYDAYFERGRAFKWLGNYKQAIKDFNKVIKLTTKDACSYYELGDIYLRMGNYKKAIIYFTKVINFSSNSASAFLVRDASYFGLGYAYAKLDNNERAINYYKMAARLGHKEAQDYLSKNGIDW